MRLQCHLRCGKHALFHLNVGNLSQSLYKKKTFAHKINVSGQRVKGIAESAGRFAGTGMTDRAPFPPAACVRADDTVADHAWRFQHSSMDPRTIQRGVNFRRRGK
jgi:hypothetical protein